MATLRDVKRKISSVTSTQTITRTMSMVSASKLRRAQEQLNRVKAYALQMGLLLRRVAATLPDEAHPLFGQREEVKNVLLFPIASDRGLCGAFNMNIAATAERFIQENRDKYENIGIYPVGRKIRDHLRRRKYELVREMVDVKALDTATVDRLAGELMGLYLDGTFDKVYLIYNHFISAAKQQVLFEEFLPITVAATDDTVDYLWEPSTEEIIDELAPRYVWTKIYYAIAESQTSEYAARKIAMENATNNSGEMIDYLTLVYNKTRQQTITNEMMDIVGGAEALQGE
jgi:F-type H+-transporting ATPase subunit gamma